MAKARCAVDRNFRNFVVPCAPPMTRTKPAVRLVPDLDFSLAEILNKGRRTCIPRKCLWQMHTYKQPSTDIEIDDLAELCRAIYIFTLFKKTRPTVWPRIKRYRH